MNPAKNFVIVKTSSIGDIIHAFPTLEYLKAKFPDCSIDWVVEKSCYALVKSHPLVRDVICIDTRKWKKHIFSRSTWKEIKDVFSVLRASRYDVVFDLQGNIKSAFVTALLRSSQKVGFSLSSLREKPNFLATNIRYSVSFQKNVRSRHLDLMKKFFRDEKSYASQEVVLSLENEDKARLQQISDGFSSDPAPTILVAFGSKWENKRLSKETLKAFLQKVYDIHNVKFLFVWASEEERNVAQELCSVFPKSDSFGKVSLPLLQALIYQVDAVIAMDSALLHLCGTTTTPSFSIFGPSSLQVYKPEGSNHVGVQGLCPYNRVFVSHCPLLRTCPTGACIKNLSPDDLASQFLAFWHQK
jgi:heptosyltransferase-1